MSTLTKENKIIILLIVSGLIIFAIGAGAGALYQFSKDNNRIIKAEELSAEIKNLSSDIVTAVAIYGNVTSISGRDVTLSYIGRTLTINIGENVGITSYLPPAEGSTEGIKKNAKFSDIKIGDNLNVAAKIEIDGKLTAKTVLVLSSSSI